MKVVLYRQHRLESAAVGMRIYTSSTPDAHIIETIDVMVRVTEKAANETNLDRNTITVEVTS